MNDRPDRRIRRDAAVSAGGGRLGVPEPQARAGPRLESVDDSDAAVNSTRYGEPMR